MAELLFIATTIFVAYVVFVVMGGKKENTESVKSEPVKPVTIKSAAPAPAPAETAPPVAAVKTADKPATSKPASPKPAAKSKSPAKKTAPAKAASSEKSVAAPVTLSDSLKNPKTGEVAKVPASYAFAKRWIKDALVEEGLLDKVYKNNELDDAATAKIQAAMQQLRSMGKYQ